MTFETDEVRRLDIGDGIYVRVPTTAPASRQSRGPRLVPGP